MIILCGKELAQMHFDGNLSGEVYDIEGRMIKRFDNASPLDGHEFRARNLCDKNSGKGCKHLTNLCFLFW